VLHRGGYLTFRIDTVERADGSRATRDVAVHPGAVAIVAVDADDQVLLVCQYRSPAEQVLLEVPAGTLDHGPGGSIEDPEIASRRELEEETGYRAGAWRLLGRFWTAPGFATELMYLYLATELSAAGADRRLPEADERLHLVRMPWRDALEAIERGEIADAKSIIGLFWLARLRGG
jgi:ADP-ribose pyrophosphatase